MSRPRGRVPLAWGWAGAVKRDDIIGFKRDARAPLSKGASVACRRP
jgi:hypothetical protein